MLVPACGDVQIDLRHALIGNIGFAEVAGIGVRRLRFAAQILFHLTQHRQQLLAVVLCWVTSAATITCAVASTAACAV